MAVKKSPAEKTVSKRSAKKTVAKKTTVKKTAKASVKKTAAKSAAKPAVKKVATKVVTSLPKMPISPPAITGALDPFKEMEKIMTKQPFQFDQMAQDAANQSREGMEAFVKSGTIFAKGFEEIIKTAASMSQNVAEKQAEFARQLMSSKTLNEYAEAQNKIAQASFDQFMSGATQISEMSVKVLNEASEPLNAQMTKAMAKSNKQMAA